MHLGQRAFGKDAGLQKTIIPLDASVSSDELGQRSGLSNIDIQRISNAYVRRLVQIHFFIRKKGNKK